MKIGIIHGFVGGGGGTEKTLEAIFEIFLEKKTEINLYTVSKPTIPIPQKIKVHSKLPIRFPIFGIYQRYLESQLIKQTKNDDIVIQASGGVTLPRFKNQKIVIYCHHDFQNEIEKSSTKYKGIWGIYYKPYYQLSKNFLKNIQDKNIFLIANSNFVQNSIKNKFGKDSIVIYPPVELSIFQNSIGKKNQVVTISRYSKEKNLEFALTAMNEVNTPYTIIGNTKTKSNLLYYEKLKTMIKNNTSINLLKDIQRNMLIEMVQNSKVYFHPSEETFGITVVESIAAGCIPVVPNNSAHLETVPFEDLRYIPDSILDARKKIQNALDGKYDYLVPQLRDTINQYSKDVFKKSFYDYIEKLS